MNVQMTVAALLDRARDQSHMSFGDMAKELGRNQTRLSEWRAGKAKPEASEIAYFADKAGFKGVDLFEAVAEIEQQLRPQYAHLWQRAIEDSWRKR